MKFVISHSDHTPFEIESAFCFMNLVVPHTVNHDDIEGTIIETDNVFGTELELELSSRLTISRTEI